MTLIQFGIAWLLLAWIVAPVVGCAIDKMGK